LVKTKTNTLVSYKQIQGLRDKDVFQTKATRKEIKSLSWLGNQQSNPADPNLKRERSFWSKDNQRKTLDRLNASQRYNSVGGNEAKSIIKVSNILISKYTFAMPWQERIVHL
jgi:hypothetical protein